MGERSKLILATALCGLIGGPAASAQAPAKPPSERFAAYVKSADYEARIIAHTLEAERAVFPECKHVAPVQHGLGGIEETPRFRAGLEHPVGGEWLDHVMIDRCRTQALENMLVTAANGQPPRIVALLPGTTEAGPLLQRDAQRIAFAAAALSAKRNGKDVQSCAATPRLVVIDTRFERRTVADRRDSGGKILAGEWDETWTVRACGDAVAVPLHFAADGKGGTYFSSRPN